MSIWDKCQEYNAMPFYGFPLSASFKDGIIIWEFPEGYAPNGSQTKEVANKLKAFVGGEILEVTDNIIRIKPNEKHIGAIIVSSFMASKLSI